MNNPFEFVLIIIAMVFLFALLKRRMENGDGRGQEPAEESRENARLRDEVSELKERIKVLERITVEKENSLSREIEDLRNR
ncbi:hypothetical protein GCM10023264_02700 [Sphingomonas daechungensis]|uniref:Uncharacterized protein n=1 Tax=Sphingomonas daechungensis TaxID=1176646 RepID=A0ABX6SZW5_9SPHN|nr:hypothetical protein [Sphingomonas daechungensis]QNP42719.1 hypothetical protein H9L15_11345 [Sphingomonas daechungensis]